MFVAGISGKSQLLFALVYTTRYLDLLSTYISAYNTFMKLVFISASYATVYLIYMKFRATYDHNHDTFRWGELLILIQVVSTVLFIQDYLFYPAKALFFCSWNLPLSCFLFFLFLFQSWVFDLASICSFHPH